MKTERISLCLIFILCNVLVLNAQETIHISLGDREDATCEIRETLMKSRSDQVKIIFERGVYYCLPDYANEKYCVNIKAKTRYVVPLVQTDDGAVRINQISETAANQIAEYLNCPKGGYYTYFDFQFVPYEEVVSKKLIKKDNA